MSENQELNSQELEQVTGGDTHESLEKLRFMYAMGFHVEVHTFKFIHQFTCHGKIVKYGYTCVNGLYSPCYYIQCEDSDVSGWYDEDYLQDTTYTSWKKVTAPITVVQ